MNEPLVALASSAAPTLMVLVGILLNRNDINRLDGRITALEGSLSGEMSALATSLRGEMAAIRSEMVAIRTQAHSDTMVLMGINNEIDKRVSRLEDSRNNE
jgi:hypothetical protein